MNRLVCAHCTKPLPAASFNAGEILCPDCHRRWFSNLAAASVVAGWREHPADDRRGERPPQFFKNSHRHDLPA